MEESTYGIAPKGMATSFGDATIPVEYVLIDKNRYRNAAGNAEKRQGIVQLGADVASGAGGAVTNTALHEMTQTNGTVIKLVSDDDGDIYRYNASANVWDLATNSAFNQAGTL